MGDCLSLYVILSVCLTVCLSVSLSLSFSLSLSLSLSLSVCLSVSLCLSASLSHSLTLSLSHSFFHIFFCCCSPFLRLFISSYFSKCWFALLVQVLAFLPATVSNICFLCIAVLNLSSFYLSLCCPLSPSLSILKMNTIYY